MNFWHKDMATEADEARAERIIRTKCRKQDPNAKGLGAVAIARQGPRAVHQRNEDRHILQGQTARTEINGKEQDVPVLNLSSNGVMIECEQPVNIGDELTLSLTECAPINTAVRWVRGGRIGLEFIAETVIIADAGVRDLILKTMMRENEEASYTPKLVIGSERRDSATRHKLVFVGKLRWGRRQATARLRNISKTGAMLSLEQRTDLTNGAKVTLSLKNAGELEGRIRWHSGNEFGVEFLKEFDVALLVNESCAELAFDPAPSGFAGRRLERDKETGEEFEGMRIIHAGIAKPHTPPDMEYRKLSLDDVYRTLYPDGHPLG